MTPSSQRPLPSDTVRAIANLVAIVGAFGVNVLSNFRPINGLNIGEISNTLFAEVKVIPASYAFAIWGVIYLGLFAFGVYQLLPDPRHNPRLRQIGYLLVVACTAQAVWVFLFLSRLFALSVVAMLVILVSLAAIYLRLGIGTQRVSRSEKWLVDGPLSIYFGWITVATIVNIASALVIAGWTGWGLTPSIWTVLLLVVSAAIAAIIAIRHRDIAYPLVIVWALVAIGVKQWPDGLISGTAFGLAIALLVLLIPGMRGERSERIEKGN